MSERLFVENGDERKDDPANPYYIDCIKVECDALYYQKAFDYHEKRNKRVAAHMQSEAGLDTYCLADECALQEELNDWTRLLTLARLSMHGSRVVVFGDQMSCKRLRDLVTGCAAFEADVPIYFLDTLVAARSFISGYRDIWLHPMENKNDNIIIDEGRLAVLVEGRLPSDCCIILAATPWPPS